MEYALPSIHNCFKNGKIMQEKLWFTGSKKFLEVFFLLVTSIITTLISAIKNLLMSQWGNNEEINKNK